MTSSEQPQSIGDCSILSLVDELLLSVIDQIDSHEALCNLAATCSRFQGLVEPYCWRSILVRKGRRASGIAIALNNRVERIAFIQELSIRYNHEHEEGIENLGGFLPHMEKLRHLHIESPCPNNSDYRRGAAFSSWTRIDYTTLFETVTLPMLQSITLHGHPSESRKFTFGKAAVIFFHPTLRDITLSCCNFDANISPGSIAPTKLKSTALQSLKLIECNVYVPFLSVVLSLPRALKKLSIGERLYCFDELPSPIATDRTSHPTFLDALVQQADSLEHLVHIAGRLDHLQAPNLTPTSCAKFARLHKLQHLSIGLESPLFALLQHNGCPPHLQTLTLSDAAFLPMPPLEHMTLMLRMASQTINRDIHTPLNIHLHFTHNHISIPTLPAIWRTPNFPYRKPIYDIANVLKTRGRGNSYFRIIADKFDAGKAYIPPYMYGENTPTQRVQYDSSAAFWTFAGVDHRAYDEELLLKPELVEDFVKARGGVDTSNRWEDLELETEPEAVVVSLEDMLVLTAVQQAYPGVGDW